MLKQGGDSNTITIVNGMKAAIKNLVDIPSQLKTAVVFDQSLFVKSAIKNLMNEGGIGLVLTASDDSAFPGQHPRHLRRPACPFLSPRWRPSSAFAVGGGSINTMVLAGLALAFSRLIDNSVVVLENIFRHLEMGATAGSGGGSRRQRSTARGARRYLYHGHRIFSGGALLYGVSRYLFTALALTVVFALFASYVVAMTVVPLYCARFIKSAGGRA